MKKVNEINLNVGTGEASRGKQPYYSGYSGGMTDSASSAYSSLVGARKFDMPLEEEDDDDDDIELNTYYEEKSKKDTTIMSDNILKYRVRSNKGYELNETLNAINEETGMLDTAAAAIKLGARGLEKGLKAAGKGAILSIPVVDTIAGTMMLVSGLASFKAVADIVVENLNSDENTFSSALAANNNTAWDNILNQVSAMHEDEREILEDNFEDLLHNIKSFFTTSIQAYDSIIAAPVAAAAGTAVPVAGAVATEAGVNLTTAAIGFLADTVPLERFFVDFAGKLAKIAVDVCEWILGKAEEDGKLNNAITGAGPVFLAIITNPVVSISRLGEFYTAIETGESPFAIYIQNNGWPLFVSVFFNVLNSDNVLDYMNLQRTISVILSGITVIPIYFIIFVV